AVVVPVIDVDGAGAIDRHVLGPVELGLRQDPPVPVVAGIRLTGDSPDDGRGGFPRRLDLRAGADLPQRSQLRPQSTADQGERQGRKPENPDNQPRVPAKWVDWFQERGSPLSPR